MCHMKRLIAISIAALSMSLSACDKGTTSDPATASRDDLNPPNSLITVTGNNQVELRFNVGNAEGEEFKGYHVFAIKKTLSELPAPTYPAGMTVAKLATTSVPKCAGNSDLFVAFKFPADTRDCEGDTATDEGAEAGGTDAAMGMADEAAADGAATDEDAPLTNMVICDGNTDTTISLPATSPQLGQMSCVVTKDSEGNALVNGETYTFFVVAVLGEDKSNISWSSNFVEDTPAVPMLDKADWVVKANKSYFISAEKLGTFATALVDADIVESACSADICSIASAGNAQTADGIYIGRLGSGSYPQRIFLSTPATSSIKIELRGNQTIDPKDGSFQSSIPGDQAIESTTYAAGSLNAIYGPVVYDIMMTVDGATHYGKLVFGQAALATPTDGATDITLPLTIIMQSDPDNVHYFN